MVDCGQCWQAKLSEAQREHERKERAEHLRREAEENLQIILKHRQLADWASERTEVNARLAAIEAKLDGLAKSKLPTIVYVKDGGFTIGTAPGVLDPFAKFTGSRDAVSPRGETKVEKSK